MGYVGGNEDETMGVAVDVCEPVAINGWDWVGIYGMFAQLVQEGW